MLSWVVKVVPQPPPPPGTLGEEDKNNTSTATDTVAKKEEVKQDPNPAKPKEEVSEENSSQTGVLSWLSHGFNSALPQPVNTSKLVNTETKQEENAVSNSNTSEETGMIGWIVQGLGKVVPQPDEKYKGHTDPEEVTEVHEIKDLLDAEPLPHIPVVEIVSDEEPDAANMPFSPRVIEWIKHGFEKVVPQSPMHLHPPSGSETPAQRPASAPLMPCKQEPATPAPKAAPAPKPAPAPEPKPAPAPEPKPAPAPAPVAPEPPKAVEDSNVTGKDKEVNMVGRIVQGLGRMMPQPVLKPKEESSDAVQSICIQQDPSDMVLEEVDSDWETKQREQATQQDIQAEEQVQQESTTLLQVLPNTLPQVLAMQEQEDAETQTERWTPLIESIKKEAEETALASIEERLQQERVEAARMAEDLARQAAELAVRQLEEEHSTQFITEPKDEVPDTEDQLPNIQEEENEEDPELQPLHEESEEENEDIKITESLVDICPAEPSPHESEASDQVIQCPPPTASPQQADNTSSKTDSVSPPVTTQPEPATSQPPHADQEEETPDEGCGVPANCSGVKSWVLRLPLASQCLNNFDQLLKKNHVTPPKLPSLPSLSPDLMQLYQELSQLPKQANQCFQNVLLHLSKLKPM